MHSPDRWRLENESRQSNLEPHTTQSNDFYNPNTEWPVLSSSRNAPSRYHSGSNPLTLLSPTDQRQPQPNTNSREPIIETHNTSAVPRLKTLHPERVFTPSVQGNKAFFSADLSDPLHSQMNLIGYAESEDDDGNPHAGRQPVSNEPGNSRQTRTSMKSAISRDVRQLSSYENELANAHETLGLLQSTMHKELDMHHVKSIVVEYMNTFPGDKDRYRNAFMIICRHQQKAFGTQKHSRPFTSQSVAPPSRGESSGHRPASNMEARGRNAMSLAPSALKNNEPKKRPLSPKPTEDKQPRKRRPFRDSSSEDDVLPVAVTSHPEQPTTTPKKHQNLLSAGTQNKGAENHTLNNTESVLRTEDVQGTEPRTGPAKDNSRNATSDGELSKDNRKHGYEPTHGYEEKDDSTRPMSLQEAFSTDHGRARVKKVLDLSSAPKKSSPPSRPHAFELNDHLDFEQESQTSSPRSIHLHTSDLSSHEEGRLESKKTSLITGNNLELKTPTNVPAKPKQSEACVPQQPLQGHSKDGSTASTAFPVPAQFGETGRVLFKKKPLLASKLDTPVSTTNKAASAVSGTDSTTAKRSSEAKPAVGGSRIDKRPSAATKPATGGARTVMNRVANTPSSAFASLLAIAEGRDTQDALKVKKSVSSAAKADPKSSDIGKAATSNRPKEPSTSVSSSARESSKDISSTTETSSPLKSYHGKKIEDADTNKKISSISESTRSTSVTGNRSDRSGQSVSGNARPTNQGMKINAKSASQTAAQSSIGDIAKSTQKPQSVARQSPRSSPSTDRTKSDIEISSTYKRAKVSSPPPNVQEKKITAPSLSKKEGSATYETNEPPVASNFSKLSKLTRRRNEQQKQMNGAASSSQAVSKDSQVERRLTVGSSQNSQTGDMPKNSTPAIASALGSTGDRSSGATRKDSGSHGRGRAEKPTRNILPEAESSHVFPKRAKEMEKGDQAFRITPPVNGKQPKLDAQTPNATFQLGTVEPARSNETLPTVHVKDVLPTPRDELAEAYFEFSIFERLWSYQDDESSVKPKEPPGYLRTCVENANRQAEDYFHATLDLHCNALRFKTTSTKSVRGMEDDCMTFSATLASIDMPSNKLHLEICVKRYVVDRAAASMRPAPAKTPFISKTMYIVGLYKLVEVPERESSSDVATNSGVSTVLEDSSSASSSSSDSESGSESELLPEKTMFAKHQRLKQKQKQKEKQKRRRGESQAPSSPPTTVTPYLKTHHPLPNGRVEAYTTQDAANIAAFNIHVEMSHEKNAKGANLQWQQQNLRNLELKLKGLGDEGLQGEQRLWKSQFNESGLGGSKYEVAVRRIGVCGPRNV
ncbi:hypothetical protein DM02DRAFT_651552 [Periconia macrospinosa]|uniref:Uncharacterized protein n=1 Tax=Periconia macrospinosa TaxID=97972 RepID=A0A2V1E222_9PLEO|nr:hypothetical protein DM02DRAFT_651552 [Periconia macrospinosa]